MDKKQGKTILLGSLIFGIITVALFLVEFQTVSKEEAIRIVNNHSNPLLDEMPLRSVQYKFLKVDEFKDGKPIFVECDAIPRINFVTENCKNSYSISEEDPKDRFMWIVDISRGPMSPEVYYVDATDGLIIGIWKPDFF